MEKNDPISRNTHPEFVGVDEIMQKQSDQLELFEYWAEQHDWTAFHTAHYDWWMFPIDQPSRLGFAYTVFDEELKMLKENSGYMKKYLRGVELLMLSWGWNLNEKKFIENPEMGQTWHDWPIRLYKCAQSLQLFGCMNELNAVLIYGRYLLNNGADFTFRGKDLSHLFLENLEQ